MNYLLIAFLALVSEAVKATDLTMTHGEATTIAVTGCARSEIGQINITNSLEGRHKLTSGCLPVFCAYTNEKIKLSTFAWTWTIKLLARDTSRDKNGVFKGDPQFDRSFKKTLHIGVETESERDALIQRYLDNGTCKGVFYDKNVPSL